MTVSYESTVREMDAEELEAEFKKLKRRKQYFMNIYERLSPNTAEYAALAVVKMDTHMTYIRKQYYQLTSKILITNGHLPTAL